MCAAQEHRGPDSRGIHLDPEVGLGIQRLRVIDLETGDQPIYNEDRTVAVVLNGEIYNYRELRRGLESRGHTLRTHGDTEVIVHLYEELGAECVEQLEGMFAFALWDTRRHRLLLARDRLGKKPLFYSERDGALSFASELSALLADREVPRDLDFHALDSYFAYQYVPSPLSAFKAVRRLPPGSTLSYEDGRVSIERFWRLRYEPQPVPEGPELHEEIRRLIRQAVSDRMISDVPLGAFLSGGIDSATVVAAMAETSPEPVRTFSIGFEDEGWNELPNARLIAERFSTGARGADRQAGPDLDHPQGREALRRALRRPVIGTHLLRLRDGTTGRDGRAQRRRRRRELRRLLPLRHRIPHAPDRVNDSHAAAPRHRGHRAADRAPG